MNYKIRVHIIAAICWAVLGSCNSTRHLKEGEYLLKSNSIQFEDNKYLENKGVMSDNLNNSIIQQPNSSFIFDGFKTKLFLYNLRYEKYQKDANNFQLESRSVEPPVIYDSSTITESKKYMEAYLFHQGYFYATVDDTTIFNNKRKKATVVYTVNSGINYLIKRVHFDNIQDSTIKSFVREASDETLLRAGKSYSADVVEKERSRITAILRDKGYYAFAKDNISFELDTVNKEYEKLDESVLESAADLLTLKKERPRPTLDIYIRITNNEEKTAFIRYGINRILVFPDFIDKRDARDSSMIVKKINNSTFRYHDYYVRSKVIHNHIFINSEGYFAQSDYDKTITELNQLGVFESVRVVYFNDTTRKDGVSWLNAAILLSRAEKYDFNTSWEASTGTTYTLGSGASVSLSNKNVAKGANLLTTTINAGVETQFDSLSQELFILTRTTGINTSLEFPKFLFPISKDRYSIRNSPRTEVALGANLLDRVNFFSLINLTSRFTYKWKETSTKSWEVSPFFINDINIFNIDPTFQARLDTNEFLANSYRKTFIEGENVTWTFNNAAKAKFYDDYSYVKLSIEEAGAVVAGLNSLKPNLTASFSQYVRLDYDLRHYIKQRHSLTALRVYGGVGLPYGQSQTLPYLKQYFVGGPFSMRGWRIRTLGPGSYVDTNAITAENSRTSALVDRTGDIKIELNGEYRFDIFKLFGGVLLFNGALFADAGNIWLSKKTESYKYGEFNVNRLYNDFAVNGGAGIRIDIASLFVLRVDVAIPLKTPENPDLKNTDLKQGWIVDEISFGDSKWRQRNMVLNVAIGYPF